MAQPHVQWAVARLIVPYLDLNSLVALRATFNRRMQNLLSSPGIIRLLDIPSGSKLSGPLRYLLTSISNVERLWLGASLCWSPVEIASLLPALNPQHLRINQHFVSLTVIRFVVQAYMNQNDPILQHVAQFFKPLGIPDFDRLTPRIESLSILCPLRSIVEADRFGLIPNEGPWALSDISETYSSVVSMPATLTSLNMRSIPPEHQIALVNALPRHLKELKISLSEGRPPIPLHSYFAQFNDLVKLEIHGFGYIALENPATVALPLSLQELSVHTLNELPVDFLSLSSLRTSSLTRLSLALNTSNSSSDTFDFAACMPPSLISLELLWFSKEKILHLPYTLTELTLQVGNHLPIDLATLRLYARLSQLKLIFGPSVYLTLSGFGGLPAGAALNGDRGLGIPFHFQMLPDSIKCLILEGDCFENPEEDVIADLSDNIASLTLPSCSIDWALALHDRSPHCLITIAQPLDAWNRGNAPWMEGEVLNFWTPEFDPHKYRQSLLSRFAAMNIIFDMELRGIPAWPTDKSSFDVFPETQSFVWRPLTPTNHAQTLFRNFDVFRRSFVDLTKIVIHQDESVPHTSSFVLRCDILPRRLIHLELLNQHIEFGDHSLPTSLTYISSNSGYSTNGLLPTFEMVPDLLHLDAPKWTFEYQRYDGWIILNLNRLCVRLIGLLDTEVVGFLVESVTPETRAQMEVSIYYRETGSLLNLRRSDHSSDSMRLPPMHSTQSILEELLDAPMGSHNQLSHMDEDESSMDEDEEFEKIGDVLISLENDRDFTHV